MALAVSSILSSAVMAESEPVIEEVVVQARRAYMGEFQPLEIPQADQLISERLLDETFAVDLNLALDLSASSARQNNFGGLWNSFAIRGFVGDENLPSNYLVNGFNAGRGFAGPRDLSGIESVEVLKGPRAALFGRGEPGGTVNLVTKRPTFATEGELTLTAGRFSQFRADLDYDTTLSENIAARLVGYYEDAESFRDTIETERYGFSPSFVFRVGERTDLTYELEYSDQSIPFDRGVVAVNGDIEALPRSRFLGEPGDGPMQADVLGHQLELGHDFSDDWSLLIGGGYRDTSLEGFSTEPELSGSRQLLITSRETPLDDGETLTRQRRFRDYDSVYQVLRAELSGNVDLGGTRHRVIVGTDWDDFENDQVFLRARASGISSDSTLEGLQAINIFNPVYGAYPLPLPGPLTDRVETQSSVGFYVQDQITLTDRLDVRLGFRYDDYEQDLVNRRNDSTSRQSESEVSPQAGIVYQATDAVSVYASYGENFRPLSGVDANGNGFEPNQTESIEVGAKFLIGDGTLLGTVSAFSIDQSNILVVDDPSAFTLAAIGEAESQGLEFDLTGEIVPGLNLWLSYAYVDAEVSNDVNDPNFGLPVRAGDRLLNIPEHQFNVQLSSAFSVAGRNARAGGGALYVGDRLGEVGSDFELPSYTLVRLFGEIDITDRLSVRADIDNLFDEEWFSNSFSSLWIQPGAPRTYRVSASFEF